MGLQQAVYKTARPDTAILCTHTSNITSPDFPALFLCHKCSRAQGPISSLMKESHGLQTYKMPDHKILIPPKN